MSDVYASLAGMLSGADEKGAQGAGGWLFGEVQEAGRRHAWKSCAAG